MTTLIALLIAMLLISLILLATAVREKKSFITITLVFSLFAISLYFFTGNLAALQEWYAVGEKHYQLQLEVAELGGIDGMILKMKQHLANNPSDARGRMLLKKLYLAKKAEGMH